MVLDTFKDGIDAVLHPEKITKSAKTVGDGLALYYKFSVIPLVLLAIVALGAGFLLQGVLAATGLVNGLLAGNLVWLVVVAVILYVWGLIPVGLLVFGVILHWIARGLGVYKGGFEGTFTAVVYGMFLPLAVLWLTVIPVIGALIQLVAFVWSVYVLVVVLSNMHKSTRVNTFVVLVAAGVVVWLVAEIVASWIAVGLLGLVLGPLLGALVATFHSALPVMGHLRAA
jgi:hypothetical protein